MAVLEDDSALSSSDDEDALLLLKGSALLASRSRAAQRKEGQRKQERDAMLQRIIQGQRADAEEMNEIRKLERRSRQANNDDSANHFGANASISGSTTITKDATTATASTTSTGNSNTVPDAATILKQRQEAKAAAAAAAQEQQQQEAKRLGLSTDDQQRMSSSSSSLWKTHPTLYRSTPRIPTGRGQVLDYLDRLLRANDGEMADSLLIPHLQQDTLEVALMRRHFRRSLMKAAAAAAAAASDGDGDSRPLPRSLVQWLILAMVVVVVDKNLQQQQQPTKRSFSQKAGGIRPKHLQGSSSSSSSSSSLGLRSKGLLLATGAYRTLREALDMTPQYPWSLYDFSQQLIHYFGLLPVTLDENDADGADTNHGPLDADTILRRHDHHHHPPIRRASPTASSGDRSKYLQNGGGGGGGIVALQRLLQLWETVLRRGMIVTTPNSTTNLVNDILECLALLVMVGSDPVVVQDRSNHIQAHIENIQSHLLGLAERHGSSTEGIDNKKKEKGGKEEDLSMPMKIYMAIQSKLLPQSSSSGGGGGEWIQNGYAAGVMSLTCPSAMLGGKEESSSLAGGGGGPSTRFRLDLIQYWLTDLLWCNKADDDDDDNNKNNNNNSFFYSEDAIKKLVLEKWNKAIAPKDNNAANQHDNDENATLMNPSDLAAALSQNMTLRGLALGYLALYHVRPIVAQEEENVANDDDGDGDDHRRGSIALAVLELAIACLHLALKDAHHHYHHNPTASREDTCDSLGQDDNATTLLLSLSKIAPSLLRRAFEDWSIVIQDLIDKSQTWIMSSTDFMRLNYYLLCLRQIPRLEKLWTGGGGNNTLFFGSTTLLAGSHQQQQQQQGTLDKFFGIAKKKAKAN